MSTIFQQEFKLGESYTREQIINVVLESFKPGTHVWIPSYLDSPKIEEHIPQDKRYNHSVLFQGLSTFMIHDLKAYQKYREKTKKGNTLRAILEIGAEKRRAIQGIQVEANLLTRLMIRDLKAENYLKLQGINSIETNRKKILEELFIYSNNFLHQEMELSIEEPTKKDTGNFGEFINSTTFGFLERDSWLLTKIS